MTSLSFLCLHLNTFSFPLYGTHYGYPPPNQIRVFRQDGVWNSYSRFEERMELWHCRIERRDRPGILTNPPDSSDALFDFIGQVVMFMWLRTVMNYQYAHGGSASQALHHLWTEGAFYVSNKLLFKYKTSM